MKTTVLGDREAVGRYSADRGAERIREAIDEKGTANIIVATGTSQFEMLTSLVAASGIEWSRVTMFHLDEYIGLPDSHPASFRRYLSERFVSKLPGLGGVHFVAGDADDPSRECQRLGELISSVSVDVAMVGIGENGHLAFNDPPADFDTEEAFLVVELDEACRRQQMGEGWFASIDEVPGRAISMSIAQIMKSRSIVVTVPDRRKAEAVRNVVTGPVTPDVPASILQRHPRCELVVDDAAASLLPRQEVP